MLPSRIQLFFTFIFVICASASPAGEEAAKAEKSDTALSSAEAQPASAVAAEIAPRAGPTSVSSSSGGNNANKNSMRTVSTRPLALNLNNIQERSGGTQNSAPQPVKVKKTTISCTHSQDEEASEATSEAPIKKDFELPKEVTEKPKKAPKIKYKPLPAIRDVRPTIARPPTPPPYPCPPSPCLTQVGRVFPFQQNFDRDFFFPPQNFERDLLFQPEFDNPFFQPSPLPSFERDFEFNKKLEAPVLEPKLFENLLSQVGRLKKELLVMEKELNDVLPTLYAHKKKVEEKRQLEMMRPPPEPVFGRLVSTNNFFPEPIKRVVPAFPPFGGFQRGVYPC